MPCEVIGVMPKALASVSAGLNPQGGGVRADRITVWTPLSVAQGLLSNRGAHLVLGVARLRQGASAALADAQMRTLRDTGQRPTLSITPEGTSPSAARCRTTSSAITATRGFCSAGRQRSSC